MIIKDYYTRMNFAADIPSFFLLKNKKQETIEIIKLWRGYFHTIMTSIPLDKDEEGRIISTGLRSEYDMGAEWSDISPEPWEIKDLPFALEQFKGSKATLLDKQTNKQLESYEEDSIPMCQDIIEMIEQAIAEDGKVYIIEDPDAREY